MDINNTYFMYIALLVFSISFVLSLIIVNIPSKYTSSEGDLIGVQKFHDSLTPRIGGVAVFASFFSGLYFLPISLNMYLSILAASLPIFIAGLVEDISAKVTPFVRMIAISVTIVLTYKLLDIKIDHLEIEFVDGLLLKYPFLVFFLTLLAGVGLVNSINIIDGYNGLMLGFIILALLAEIYVAYAVGDFLVFQIGVVFISSLLGLFVFNFPFGKIFSGDSGAYFIGFISALIGLILSNRNSSVSYWFVMLLFIYPLFETVFSIYRKKIVRGTSVSEPDGFHLHMMVFKRIVKCKYFDSKIMCNSATSPLLWLLSLFGIIPAVVWYNEPYILIIFSVLFMLLYGVIYRRIVLFRFK